MLPGKKPPGPRFPWFLFLGVYFNPLPTLTGAVRKYGDIVHIRTAGRDHFLLNHPDHVRAILLDQDYMRRSVHPPLKKFLGKGLLSSEGRFHQNQRRLLQPAFHKDRIAAFGDIMVQESSRLSEAWQDGATVDLRDEMLHLTMGIIGKYLFNADLNSDARELGEALDVVVVATTRMDFALFSSVQKRLPFLRNRRLERVRERLDQLVYQMITDRRAGKGDESDLLSMLVRLRDSEDAPVRLTDKQIRDEILTLFSAGHETIANGLMWTWYLLSQNPDATRKLHAELDHVLAGRLPTVADLDQLTYTRMVFSESMRLYPPVWIMGRRALRDTPVGDWVIPHESSVHISQFLMHRDARFFPEPERFDPERWTPEGIASRPRYSYFPFGGGGLQCIGEGFAWTEGMLVIATLASRWRMKLVPGHRVELEPRITLRSRYGMPVILERRKGTADKHEGSLRVGEFKS
jgi:cytochrome P450